MGDALGFNSGTATSPSKLDRDISLISKLDKINHVIDKGAANWF